MPLKNENVAAGLGVKDKRQVGISDADNDAVIEQDILIPWATEASASYIYYECVLGSMLDSGIVVHNRLPQINNDADTLATADYTDPNLDKVTGFGVNLKCKDQYADIVQRMGHARYWFRLWGQALRVGYQVPIPTIKSIGGVPAIPYDRNPQWGYNSIFPGGNYGGVILWRAQWSLWFTTAVPPVGGQVPASDPSAHINDKAPLPTSGIQSPFSQADDEAVKGGGGKDFFT